MRLSRPMQSALFFSSNYNALLSRLAPCGFGILHVHILDAINITTLVVSAAWLFYSSQSLPVGAACAPAGSPFLVTSRLIVSRSDTEIAWTSNAIREVSLSS